MSFTHEIKENIILFQNSPVKAIEVKIIHGTGKFEHRSLSLTLSVSDGVNTAQGFYSEISGNQKEFLTYFLLDAFTSFSTSSDIIFGYASFPDENTISGVDVTNVTEVYDHMEPPPHDDADSTWFAGL